MPISLDEQLTKYLTDAHSIEQMARAQLTAAPELAVDPTLAATFATHLTETEDHERLVRARLEARGASPAAPKDLAGALTGKGFVAFARGNPDTPGKLIAHAFSYEHMELAAYDMISRVAERAGDHETVRVAARIEQQERRMARRLAACFDRTVDVVLGQDPPQRLGEQLDNYLADAHAIESQATTLLEHAPAIAGDRELADAYEDHLAETREHRELVAARLAARGGGPSRIKDAALRLGALNWSMFFRAQPDTPAKLAAFAYAFEHLEIAAYELLERVARRAGDRDTELLTRRILGQEHAAAERIYANFDRALDASLDEVQVQVG